MIIKEYKSNLGTVNIHDDYIPKNQEELKQNLKNTYDCINMICSNIENPNIKTDKLFYSEKELKKVSNDSKYIFI